MCYKIKRRVRVQIKKRGEITNERVCVFVYLTIDIQFE